MAGKDMFAGAGGTLYDPGADGKQPFVLFHDLPPIQAGKVPTIWLVSPDSTWGRAATFQPNGQDIQAAPINVEGPRFDHCPATLEDSPRRARYRRALSEARLPPATRAPQCL